MTATRKMRPSNGLLLLRGFWSVRSHIISDCSRLSYCTIECSKSTGVQTSAPLCVKSDDLPLYHLRGEISGQGQGQEQRPARAFWSVGSAPARSMLRTHRSLPPLQSSD
jgi:hypothetical protein